MGRSELKFWLMLILIALAIAMLGAGACYFGSLYLHPWLLALVLSVVVPTGGALILVRTCRESETGDFLAAAMTVGGTIAGVIIAFILSGIFWIGCLIGMWIAVGFLAAVINNLLWPFLCGLWLAFVQCLSSLEERKFRKQISKQQRQE